MTSPAIPRVRVAARCLRINPSTGYVCSLIIGHNGDHEARDMNKQALVSWKQEPNGPAL